MGYCFKCARESTSDEKCDKCGKIVMVSPGRAKAINEAILKREREAKKEAERKKLAR